MDSTKTKSSPRKAFFKCGTCSQAMFHLLNNEFDTSKPIEEKAADLLAGGIAQKGEQCGLLWGGALAIGTEAYKKYIDRNVATTVAIKTSRALIESFEERTNSADCRDVANVNWEDKWQSIFHIIKVMAQGMVFSHCFNLIAKWTPEAIEAVNREFLKEINVSGECKSCATVMLRKAGATEEEAMMVAGFAGGIGLKGKGCGALAAAIWYKMLIWVRDNPGKATPFLNNEDAKKIISSFSSQTDSELVCEKIIKKKFKSVEEHTDYINDGGCSNIIESLVSSLSKDQEAIAVI